MRQTYRNFCGVRCPHLTHHSVIATPHLMRGKQPLTQNWRYIPFQPGFKRSVTWRVYNWRFIVTILSILTLCVSASFADTTWVAGTVSGVWGRRGNPYIVTDTLTIPQNSTLQILPGVQIYFQNQQIRRTPINVLGRLRAIGEEGDSIYFYSPVAGFGGIDNHSTTGSEIRLEYCVIDSTYGYIHSELAQMILTHSRIYRSNIYNIISTLDNVDTIKYCNFYAIENSFGIYIELDHGGPSVFQYNYAPYVSLTTWREQIAPIHDNKMQGIIVSDQSYTEIYNNNLGYQYYLTAGMAGDCDTYWHDNHLTGTLSIYGGTFIPQILVERNTINGYLVRIDNCRGTVQNNIMDGQLRIVESQITSIKNLVISPIWGIEVMGICSNIIQGNTIVFNSYGILAVGTSGVNQVINNIFLGDGINCTGIYSTSPIDFNIRFNDFHQVTSATYNCQLDTGNIFLDPRFRAGNPYDYQLQANSPCIDAGDPTSPLDPDGTRADMGCYFFDHRIDNPPAINSPVVVNVQRGTTLRYIARATDDFGPLSFDFWNLPAWLYRVPELMDFEQKTAVVSGRVPQGQQNFTFGVWVQDGSAQRDSQVVSVLVSHYTILAGEVTGVLTQEQSPYMVVEDVVVPAGDSLVIEPGVEIRFQWEPVEDLRHRIVVRGKLHAVGTVEDTIRFLPEFGDSLSWAWRGIWSVGRPQDTSRFAYAYFLNGYFGIAVDSQGTATVKHTRLVDTRYGIHISNGSWAEVDSCQYLVYNPDANNSLYVYSATATITNSVSEILVPCDNAMHFDVNDSSFVTIQGCTFVGSCAGQADHGSRLEFIGNRVMGVNDGVGYLNLASGIVANNIFSNGRGVGAYGADSLLISNNLFFNTDIGVEFTGPALEESIKNNIFLDNGIGIKMYYSFPPFTYISYNDFFDNDTNFVNSIPDSTNLYLDPIVQDTINFRLSAGSPCSDAGDPDPFFNDVDSTRNDIGCWGGPWGESYSYVPVLSQQTKPMPTVFALLPPYPNPFNSVLVIPFTIPVEKEVMITIYNILGQKVQEFTFPSQSPGMHRVIWNSAECASGIYFVRMKANGQEYKQKVVLLK